MNTKRYRIQFSLLIMAMLSSVGNAQLTFTTNNGAITITGYSGYAGAVAIPNTTNGLPVTTIAASAFIYNDTLTSIAIPASVTNIETWALDDCGNLTNITVDNSNRAYAAVAGVLFNSQLTELIQYPSGNFATSYMIPNSVTYLVNAPFKGAWRLTAITIDPSNPVYTSVNGVLFNKNMTTVIQYPAGNFANSYAIPASVTNIADYSFWDCDLNSITIPASVTSIGYDVFENSVLLSVTIPQSVRSIGQWAFYDCRSLNAVYFFGNAPSADSTVFSGDAGTVYYLAGTTGWGPTFGGLPTALWYRAQPLILSAANGNTNFGVYSNQFNFTVSWATNLSVVVQASTNLANPAWQPLQTNTLINGKFYFSDPTWTNHPGRFYRLRSP